MFDVFNKKNVKNAKLVEYRTSSGGDMRGGGSSTTVKVYDETHVIVIFTNREHHAAKEEVKEYLADTKIIEEIENVFREYDMHKWDNKKFTDMFVCDGASTSYGFYFDNHESINFSSQIYPRPYSEKLKKINEVIEKYRDTFKKHH